jgi:ssDNA-binding Zn-finger/Zn-ribbon topoisomerase 1
MSYNQRPNKRSKYFEGDEHDYYYIIDKEDYNKLKNTYINICTTCNHNLFVWELKKNYIKMGGCKCKKNDDMELSTNEPILLKEKEAKYLFNNLTKDNNEWIVVNIELEELFTKLAIGDFKNKELKIEEIDMLENMFKKMNN